MTTIAAKHSTLQIAADTMVSDDSCFYAADKLRKGKKSIYGACGDFNHMLRAYELIETGSKEWNNEFDFTVMELRADGIYLYESCMIPVKIKHDYWAVGSGSAYAIAAMRLGCSPAEAVAIACEFDTSSRPPIDSMTLEVKGASKNNRRPRTD